ncbi:MAG: translation initiation factor IF-2 [Chloroflexi bacterium]|nr:translation initiation factor IF-2 [Chloroflexota bacterium]
MPSKPPQTRKPPARRSRPPFRGGPARRGASANRRAAPPPSSTPQAAAAAAPAQPAAPAAPKALGLPRSLTVKNLADKMDISGVEVIKRLIRNGVMATINQRIDFDTAAIVASDFGFEAKEAPQTEKETAVSILETGRVTEDDPSKLEPRPPVVTILGHVDHGKTTLLDAIRQTKVAASEVGGITQHIGAYQVEIKDHKITFLDTPGHEAFTAMRARGAKATDIAVLVVAADDGVMPQTIEAIDHAKAAGVPIVIAVNKIDKADANPDRIKQQLTEHGVVVEEYGGDVPAVPVSAKQRKGIDDLLEMILLVSEIQQFKANPHRPAAGVVIEAKLDKSKGPLATVLVQTGTLTVADSIIVGDTWGKIKAMLTETGKRLKEAGPATPVEVLGLNAVPPAGTTFVAVKDEKTARAYVEHKRRETEQAAAVAAKPVTLEDVFAQIKEGQVKSLNLILKTDVQGSIQPIKESLERLSTDKAVVKLLHTGSGAINESDVLLALASKAIIIGLTTRVVPGAQRVAETERVDIRRYDIIYELVEDVRKALEGLLEPVQVEVVVGQAEVRAVFPVGKKGKAAGVFVREGRMVRGHRVKVVRGGQQVADGSISSLKHFKEDVRELAAGNEGGVGMDNFNDFAAGDVLQCYRREKSTGGGS